MGNKEEKNKTILNFIDRFTSNGARQEVIDCFQNGCCYWFAYILLKRFEDFYFPQSKIYYDEIANHFGYYDQEANRVYDITGDVTNKYNWELSWEEIIDKDLIMEPGLDRTLMGDGLATFAAGMIGGPANTTYGENTSVVGMTKVASVWVLGLAALIAIMFGFLGQLTAIISSIPSAVLGGVSILLYGFISVNGLKVLIQNKVDFENIKNVIVASSMLVLGLGGAAISIATKNFSLSISGMSLAAIIGILLNLLIKEK